MIIIIIIKHYNVYLQIDGYNLVDRYLNQQILEKVLFIIKYITHCL